MKCCFLRLQICDQRLKPFNRDLIANFQIGIPRPSDGIERRRSGAEARAAALARL
jgi:hypothetical protein